MDKNEIAINKPIRVPKSIHNLCMKEYGGLFFGREDSSQKEKTWWLKPATSQAVKLLKQIFDQINALTNSTNNSRI